MTLPVLSGAFVSWFLSPRDSDCAAASTKVFTVLETFVVVAGADLPTTTVAGMLLADAPPLAACRDWAADGVADFTVGVVGVPAAAPFLPVAETAAGAGLRMAGWLGAAAFAATLATTLGAILVVIWTGALAGIARGAADGFAFDFEDAAAEAFAVGAVWAGADLVSGRLADVLARAADFGADGWRAAALGGVGLAGRAAGEVAAGEAAAVERVFGDGARTARAAVLPAGLPGTAVARRVDFTISIPVFRAVAVQMPADSSPSGALFKCLRLQVKQLQASAAAFWRVTLPTS